MVKPINQANFFCSAPTNSGFWLLTIILPIINNGAYFGLMNKRIKNSTTKTDNTYFTGTKFPLLKIRTKEIKAIRNIIPAVARISRLLRTGIS